MSSQPTCDRPNYNLGLKERSDDGIYINSARDFEIGIASLVKRKHKEYTLGTRRSIGNSDRCEPAVRPGIGRRPQENQGDELYLDWCRGVTTCSGAKTGVRL